MECAGAQVVFDGVDSPITQSFGLGIFEELTADVLDEVERFFRDRGAPVLHEVSPFAGLNALGLLCARNYRPVEISNVLYQPLGKLAAEEHSEIRVRIIGPEDAAVWGDVSARGWAHEHPEFMDFLLAAGSICTAREDSVCFLGEAGGVVGAASVLYLHDGVALFGGSSTIPEMRHRGLHGALLRARMRYAFDHGCDLALMVAEAGSNSQRNAEREGFRVAYTRTKWKLWI